MADQHDHSAMPDVGTTETGEAVTLEGALLKGRCPQQWLFTRALPILHLLPAAITEPREPDALFSCLIHGESGVASQGA